MDGVQGQTRLIQVSTSLQTLKGWRYLLEAAGWLQPASIPEEPGRGPSASPVGDAKNGEALTILSEPTDSSGDTSHKERAKWCHCPYCPTVESGGTSGLHLLNF